MTTDMIKMDTQFLIEGIEKLWLDRVKSGESISVTQERETTLIEQWKNEYLFRDLAGVFNADVLATLYARAYEDGHSAGPYQIESCFDRLVNLAYALRNDGL